MLNAGRNAVSQEMAGALLVAYVVGGNTVHSQVFADTLFACSQRLSAKAPFLPCGCLAQSFRVSIDRQVPFVELILTHGGEE